MPTCFDHCSSSSFSEEVQHLKIFANTVDPQAVRTPAIDDAIIAAVEREPRLSRDVAEEFGLFQRRAFELFPCQWLGRARLLPTSAACGQAKARGCVKHPQQSRLYTRQSSCCSRRRCPIRFGANLWAAVVRDVVGRDSSVGVTTRYGLDGLRIEFRWT